MAIPGPFYVYERGVEVGWKLKDKPKTMKVTKALATEFAEMDAAPHDRNLSERRLQVYQRLLVSGEFRPVTWARAYCAETSGTYRVNGKHTSVMLSGISPMPEFYVTIEDYVCDTLDDVARLYATFDSKMQSRTARDIYLSFAGTVPELAEVADRNIGVSAAGMAYAVHGEGSFNLQAADRAELLLEHPEFVLWLHNIFSYVEAGDVERRSVKHLVRAAVVAAMFGTWQRVKLDSTRFWTAVRDESGEIPSLPDRKLARYLLSVGINSGAGVRRVKVVTHREVYVKCIHAWNAWRREETTNLNYYPDADVPTIR